MLTIHCYSLWYTNICYLLIINISLITVIVFTAQLFFKVYLCILDILRAIKNNCKFKENFSCREAMFDRNANAILDCIEKTGN